MLSWFKKKVQSPSTPESEVKETLEEISQQKEPVDQVEETNSIDSLEGKQPQAPEKKPPQPAGEKAIAHKDKFKQEPSPMEKKGSFLTRLSEKLDKTKESFTYQLDTILLGKKEIDFDLLEELEELLITADIGIATTEELLESIRRRVKRSELTNPEKLKEFLKKEIREYITSNEEDAALVMPPKGPFVIMVIGVNGVGKTTTIGKIAHKFMSSGRSVMLAAGDTFRAAAVSQLKIWGERNGVPVIAHREGADPSSVVFDALSSAIAKDIDVLLVDTAGRMHTKDNLMEELKKIKRVMAKKLPKAPHETLLVLDATTGQNAISQARLFDDAVDISGLALTKLDGTSKGGIVINICREMKVPLRFVGVGEQIEDLRDFDAEEFADALFAEKKQPSLLH